MSCKLFFSQGIGVHGSFSKSFGLNDDGAPKETILELFFLNLWPTCHSSSLLSF